MKKSSLVHTMRNKFLDTSQLPSQSTSLLEMSRACEEAKGRQMEESPPPKPASFATQMDALMRKNITFQRRNLRTNLALIAFPILLCLLLLGIQQVVSFAKETPGKQCECRDCVLKEGEDSCESECTEEIFDMMIGTVSSCPEPNPTKWPALFQIPDSRFRATRSKSTSNYYTGLPDESCREDDSCPVTILLTGSNHSLAESLGQNFFGSEPFSNPSDSLEPLTVASNFILGTTMEPGSTYSFEPAFMMLAPSLYIVQPNCKPNFTFPLSIRMNGLSLWQDVKCARGLHLWRNSSSEISSELYTGYQMGDSEKKINEFLAAYDFLNTDESIFNVTVWHNGTYKNLGPMLRILRAVNVASNSYLQFFKGAHVKMLLEFIKEMPKGKTTSEILNISNLLGPLFFTWVIELLFPVMLIYLVYEKEKNLRMIMKMHGLGDGPYWTITYAYFHFISSAYVLSFLVFGSIIGLKTFTMNDYSVQLVFYYVYINLQIALAFLSSTFFPDVKTATVVGYIYVLGSGLLGYFLLERLIQDAYPRELLQLMEIFPGFSLYRGLYELAQYSFQVENMGASRMGWKNIYNDKKNNMRPVLIIMIVEWAILLMLAYYFDQVVSYGSGVRKHPLWFLPCFNGRPMRNMQRQGYDVLISMEKPDVSQERELVEKLLREPCKSRAIICDNLKKVYPRRDGTPKRTVVGELSLAIPRGECFGVLGPNGAGKTSFINMMTGLIMPTSGTAFVQGLDICEDMDKVYSSMGVCPQHDLIWEMLTGREHLLFYGRLKNLKGDVLTRAVEESLQRVNLCDKGVANKLSGHYSGGMKRRLSVAISLIGNPRVVYMDEPSTGLDPASRKNLWRILQCAKEDKAIILTTHSMEEAEVLCDRVGIFVDGNLQCLGNPKDLKARYGGFYVFTMTTPSNEEEEVEKLIYRLSPRANKVYHLSGTQKFQLPKQEIKLADVFREVEHAKRKLNIQAWGLADATLEDVFIKVVKGAQSLNELS